MNLFSLKTMGILIEDFKNDFHLVTTGNRGWYVSKVKSTELYCPSCHNENSSKIAFIFSNICSFRCVKCGASMRLEKYLWKIKKPEYISNQRQIQQKDILEKKSLKILTPTKEIEQLEEISLPLFFKRIKYSAYLQSRGAKMDLYKHWIIGKTDFEESLKNFIIFVITENGKNIGWVARNQKSKKEIDKYNSIHNKKILRWRNSKNDFAKIVFGLDEITEDTEELIIVEGLTSKMRIDCELELYKQNKIVCCCTFGKKFSEVQIQKVKTKGKKVKKITLFYDSDAIKASKKVIYNLIYEFKKINVAFCTYKDEEGNFKDAGDLNKEELLEILNNAQSPFEFFESKMEKRLLVRK